MDRLIQKIKIEDKVEDNSYTSLIKRFAMDDKIEFNTAKVLISEYGKNTEGDDL